MFKCMLAQAYPKRGFFYLALRQHWQSAVTTPAASASPKSLLKMQTLRLLPRLTETEALQAGPSTLFKQALWVVPVHAKTGEALLEAWPNQISLSLLMK